MNIWPQASAYRAIFETFWAPEYSWFGGLSVWDISVDPARKGPLDTGFSPIGKTETDAVFQEFLR